MSLSHLKRVEHADIIRRSDIRLQPNGTLLQTQPGNELPFPTPPPSLSDAPLPSPPPPPSPIVPETPKEEPTATSPVLAAAVRQSHTEAAREARASGGIPTPTNPPSLITIPIPTQKVESNDPETELQNIRASLRPNMGRKEKGMRMAALNQWKQKYPNLVSVYQSFINDLLSLLK